MEGKSSCSAVSDRVSSAGIGDRSTCIGEKSGSSPHRAPQRHERHTQENLHDAQSEFSVHSATPQRVRIPLLIESHIDVDERNRRHPYH